MRARQYPGVPGHEVRERKKRQPNLILLGLPMVVEKNKSGRSALYQRMENTKS